jgi:hypothetical protein
MQLCCGFEEPWLQKGIDQQEQLCKQVVEQRQFLGNSYVDMFPWQRENMY